MKASVFRKIFCFFDGNNKTRVLAAISFQSQNRQRYPEPEKQDASQKG
jgi:hypothetical protein